MPKQKPSPQARALLILLITKYKSHSHSSDRSNSAPSSCLCGSSSPPCRLRQKMQPRSRRLRGNVCLSHSPRGLSLLSHVLIWAERGRIWEGKGGQMRLENISDRQTPMAMTETRPSSHVLTRPGPGGITNVTKLGKDKTHSYNAT